MFDNPIEAATWSIGILLYRYSLEYGIRCLIYTEMVKYLTIKVAHLLLKSADLLGGKKYSTKHIISALQENGHVIKTLLFCGGLSKNSLYIQMHADVTGLPVIIPDTSEPVLVGCAILAASAAKYYLSVEEAMKSMCGTGKLIEPQLEDKEFHRKKYEAFLSLLKCQENIRRIMNKS